ncbi:MAG: hypothetical protein V4557_18845, partial [Bacteroidota bacterium]
VSGTIVTPAQPNITSVGSLSNLTVTGTIVAGTLSGTLSAGTLAGITFDNLSSLTVNGALTATTVSGTIVTPAQPNITSLGSLSNLTVAGTIVAGTLSGTIVKPAQPNITSLGSLSNLTVTGNIRAQSLFISVNTQMDGTLNVGLPSFIQLTDAALHRLPGAISNVQGIASSYDLGLNISAQDAFIYSTASSNTYTLPVSTSVVKGKTIYIRGSATKPFTVRCQGSDIILLFDDTTIDVNSSTLSRVLAMYVSDGAGKWIEVKWQ